MIVYITKYWETKGIIEKDVRNAGENMVASTDPKDSWSPYYHKPYWHKDLKSAEEHAECLRLKRISSMEKKISKLKSKSFIKK